MVWTISLLALLVAALGARCIAALDFTDRLGRQFQASYIARSALQCAVALLKADATSFDGQSEIWMNAPELFERKPFGDGTFSLLYPLTEGGVTKTRYGFLDENRKINLNTATEEILRNLIQEVGHLRESEILGIVDSVLDWRDEDNEKRGYGAEDFDYLGMEHAYECKDAPFESVEELLLVRGVTPELFARITPYLTVYGSGVVNLNTAPPEVLRALGISSQGVAGIVFYRAGEDNTEGTSDDRVLSSVTGLSGELASRVSVEDITLLTQLASQRRVAVRSDVFHLFIQAWVGSDEKGRVDAECVIDREGNLLAWSER